MTSFLNFCDQIMLNFSNFWAHALFREFLHSRIFGIFKFLRFWWFSLKNKLYDFCKKFCMEVTGSWCARSGTGILTRSLWIFNLTLCRINCGSIKYLGQNLDFLVYLNPTETKFFNLSIGTPLPYIQNARGDARNPLIIFLKLNIDPQILGFYELKWFSQKISAKNQRLKNIPYDCF